MRKIFLLILPFLYCKIISAQPISQRLDAEVKHLLADSQVKHAILGLYIINSKTGEVVYDVNSNMGLAPASTQKIFTSIAAFDLLGHDYTYKTEIGYTGEIKGNVLHGNLVIAGYGDPSFGSWRFNSTKRDAALKQLTTFITKAGIHTIAKDVVLDNSRFSYQPIPGGWIWDDIGNYYGAGTWAINWNENQYDLILKPGAHEGDEVKLIRTDPKLDKWNSLDNHLKTGKPNSGDNGYIYLPPYADKGFIEGTEPLGDTVIISGALPNPLRQFEMELSGAFKKNNIALSDTSSWYDLTGIGDERKKIYSFQQPLGVYYSPPLDSLVYWFLQKSINLYGEAFAKTIAYEKTGMGETEKGVELIRGFWQQHGIEKSAINMLDGSGLSPQNRVTAQAEVMALQYAKTRPWYNSFYTALPTYNGIKMKSGTIGGSKAFTGYHKAADGNEYTFSIIINNYDGPAGALVKKMYTVLNELK